MDGSAKPVSASKHSQISELISSLQEISQRNSLMSFKLSACLLGTPPTDSEKPTEATTAPGMFEDMIQTLKEIRARLIDANRNLEEIQKELDIS